MHLFICALNFIAFNEFAMKEEISCLLEDLVISYANDFAINRALYNKVDRILMQSTPSSVVPCLSASVCFFGSALVFLELYLLF